MKYQMDHAKQEPKLYPPGFRFVVRAREDWVRNEQDWPGKSLLSEVYYFKISAET
jgi:hypothetical protein